MELISNYKRIFNSILTKKCSIINYNLKKEEFDKIIMSVDQDINCNNFPLLYQFLLKNKKLKMNQPLLYTNVKKIYEPIKKPEKKEKKEERKEKKEKIKNEIILENDLKSEIPISSEKINQFFKEETNNGKIIFTKEYLEEMSKESIILHCININNKLNNIENNLNEANKKINILNNIQKKFNNENKELKNKINQLNEKINQLIKIGSSLKESISNKKNIYNNTINKNQENTIQNLQNLIEEKEKEKKRVMNDVDNFYQSMDIVLSQYESISETILSNCNFNTNK
jgi:chromosome segregation ATPase